MNTLRIPVTSIGVEGCVFEERVRVVSIKPPNIKALPVETVEVRGRFEPLGDEFLFRGHISGVYEGACVRCLEASQSPFDVEVAWVFSEGPAAVFEEIGHALEMDDEGVTDVDVPENDRRSFQGHDINLAPYVWEEVVFAQPSRYLCRDDCKGLCSRCGANQNDGLCQCAERQKEEPIGNRGLAVLADLYPELAPDKTKE